MSPAAKGGPPTSGLSPRKRRSTPASQPREDCLGLVASVPASLGLWLIPERDYRTGLTFLAVNETLDEIAFAGISSLKGPFRVAEKAKHLAVERDFESAGREPCCVSRRDRIRIAPECQPGFASRAEPQVFWVLWPREGKSDVAFVRQQHPLSKRHLRWIRLRKVVCRHKGHTRAIGIAPFAKRQL